MSHRVLQWDKATPDAAGGITVPIYPPPDLTWLEAFESAHSARQREVRGQVYDDACIRGSCLVLTGLRTDALPQTRSFFDIVAQKASHDAARLIEQREAVRAGIV